MCKRDVDGVEVELGDSRSFHEEVVLFEKSEYWVWLLSEMGAPRDIVCSTGGEQYIGTGIFKGRRGSEASELRTLIACLIEGRRSQSG